MGESVSAQPEETTEETISYSPARRAKRSSRSAQQRSRTRLRRLYFSLAAIWGFLVGTGAILGGLAARGRPLRLDPIVAVLLLAAGGMALIGGIIAAAAYREARRRQR